MKHWLVTYIFYNSKSEKMIFSSINFITFLFSYPRQCKSISLNPIMKAVSKNYLLPIALMRKIHLNFITYLFTYQLLL